MYKLTHNWSHLEYFLNMTESNCTINSQTNDEGVNDKSPLNLNINFEAIFYPNFFFNIKSVNTMYSTVQHKTIITNK